MVDPVRRRGFGRAAARRAGGGLLPVSGGGLPVSAAEAEEAAATRRAARRWSPPRAARAPLRHRSPLCPCQRARRVRRTPSLGFNDVSGKPSFFFTVPARNPRTQSVACIISSMLAPAGWLSSVSTRSCLVTRVEKLLRIDLDATQGPVSFVRQVLDRLFGPG